MKTDGDTNESPGKGTCAFTCVSNSRKMVNQCKYLIHGTESQCLLVRVIASFKNILEEEQPLLVSHEG